MSVVVLAVLLSAATAHGLTVTPTGDPATLVNTILGPGITLLPGSAVYLGSSVASGTFSDGQSSGIGIESGILLTTGTAADAVGDPPGVNSNGSVAETIGGLGSSDDTTTDLGLPGDADLDTLAGYPTLDSSVLEFDFQNEFSGDVTFRFAFASEEYIDFVNTEFNDVFGFYLDGVNIGLVPGTTSPISVNTINPLMNSVYYKNNINPAPYMIEYDGFTTVITARFLGLAPGTHHMKLAIADGSDHILDAAVFIEAGSFTFTPIEVPLDVKPRSCPNPVNFASQGVIPAAILGTADLDVTAIDPATVTLNGVLPVRWSYEDIATPFVPFMGKQGCSDCNELWSDGYQDLALKFDSQAIVATLGTTVKDGDCVRLDLAGALKAEFGGIPILGEDFVVLRIKKK
jgi:hypothetical protein